MTGTEPGEASAVADDAAIAENEAVVAKREHYRMALGEADAKVENAEQARLLVIEAADEKIAAAKAVRDEAEAQLAAVEPEQE